jgi:hypothetical protein
MQCLIDEPQLSSPAEGPPRGSRNRNDICCSEGDALREWLRSMRYDVGPPELRDLHNLFVKTLDAKLLARSSIEGRFASLCSGCAEFTTVRLNVERINQHVNGHRNPLAAQRQSGGELVNVFSEFGICLGGLKSTDSESHALRENTHCGIMNQRLTMLFI